MDCVHRSPITIENLRPSFALRIQQRRRRAESKVGLIPTRGLACDTPSPSKCGEPNPVSIVQWGKMHREEDLPTGFPGQKLPKLDFQGSPPLVGRRTKLVQPTDPFYRRPALTTHLPRQNWLKMESSKSSMEVLPTTSPKALSATRSSKATNSSVCWLSNPEQVWRTASRARSSTR